MNDLHCMIHESVRNVAVNLSVVAAKQMETQAATGGEPRAKEKPVAFGHPDGRMQYSC